MKSRKALLEGLLKANDLSLDIKRYLKQMGELCPRNIRELININKACEYLYDELLSVEEEE